MIENNKNSNHINYQSLPLILLKTISILNQYHYHYILQTNKK